MYSFRDISISKAVLAGRPLILNSVRYLRNNCAPLVITALYVDGAMTISTGRQAGGASHILENVGMEEERERKASCPHATHVIAK